MQSQASNSHCESVPPQLTWSSSEVKEAMKVSRREKNGGWKHIIKEAIGEVEFSQKGSHLYLDKVSVHPSFLAEIYLYLENDRVVDKYLLGNR